jgi:hypothetical protein
MNKHNNNLKQLISFAPVYYSQWHNFRLKSVEWKAEGLKALKGERQRPVVYGVWESVVSPQQGQRQSPKS